jgi:type III pantothenate kinase
VATNASHVLLIDEGNTSIKSVVMADFPNGIIRSNSVDDLLFLLPTLKNITDIYLASVASDTLFLKLSAYCQKQRVNFHHIVTEREAFGIRNSYEVVENLGVDRWLAMIAGNKMTKFPFIVIDAGTAITCDFVANGQHLGGWITPGYTSMRSALVKNTTKVFTNNEIPDNLIAAKSTESCVNQGCLAAVQGVVLAAERLMSAQFERFSIILAGGDKKILTSVFLGDSLSSENLVLQGLARYAESDF